MHALNDDQEPTPPTCCCNIQGLVEGVLTSFELNAKSLAPRDVEVAVNVVNTLSMVSALRDKLAAFLAAALPEALQGADAALLFHLNKVSWAS